MPDILPVSVQDILYSREPDLREQKVRHKKTNMGKRQRSQKPLPYACMKERYFS